MKKENKDIIKCNFCNLEAVVNYQKVWVKFKIDEKGNYRKDNKFCGGNFEQPINEDNIHLCKKHNKDWLEGEIY